MRSVTIMKKIFTVMLAILALALLSVIGTIVYIKIFSPINGFL